MSEIYTASESGEEQVIGHYEAKESGEEKDNPAYLRGNRHLCANCKKRIHNDKKTLTRCKGHPCECLCQWYYPGLDGKLRKHGEPDNSFMQEKKTDLTQAEDVLKSFRDGDNIRECADCWLKNTECYPFPSYHSSLIWLCRKCHDIRKAILQKCEEAG